MKLLYYILICFFGGVMSLSAQLRLEAEAPATVDINEPYFQVRYRIGSADVGDLKSPQFQGFEVLAGPTLSTRRESIFYNGREQSRESTTFTFTLAPQKKGTYSIGPASVEVNGRTYTSRAVTVKVVGSGERKPGGNPSAASRAEQLRTAGSTVSPSDLYISATLGKHEVYEQEGVLLTYKFYERPGVGLNTVGLNQKPDFKAMVSQDIPVKNIEANLERVGGQAYRTGVVQQYLIYPQQAGHLLIPGLTFDCVVIQRDNTLNTLDAFFNGGGNIGQSLKRQAPELYLTVKPLPQPKPAGFSGGVGQFSVHRELISPQLRTNEVATYRVTVSGTGNLKLLVAPTLTFPSDFDTYSPKVSDETEVTLNGVTGKVVFDYTFVPRNIGRYELPAVHFVYFDPEAQGYKTIDISEMSVDVRKGNRNDTDMERERRMRQSDIRDIRPGKRDLLAENEIMWWGQWSYWAVNVAVLAFGLLAVYGLRRYLRYIGTNGQRRKASGLVMRRLKSARATLDSGHIQEFYSEVAKALYEYLSEKLGLPLSELNQERLQETLAAHCVPEGLSAALLKIIDECEYVRFATSAVNAASAAELYDEAVSLMDKLNMCLSKNRK